MTQKIKCPRLSDGPATTARRFKNAPCQSVSVLQVNLCAGVS